MNVYFAEIRNDTMSSIEGRLNTSLLLEKERRKKVCVNKRKKESLQISIICVFSIRNEKKKSTIEFIEKKNFLVQTRDFRSFCQEHHQPFVDVDHCDFHWFG